MTGEHAPPEGVVEIENVWIEMADGCRLAARLWLPEEAESRPVPAVLEYIPYRKRDFTRERDEPIHRYFASAGYAALRVDVRGTGDSDGVLDDEYSPVELDDALQLVAWIARQAWCSGAVGMIGKSWGGFNALQIAALRPPALRAIVTVCSTDDRYADDAHYKGGCLLNENLQWGTILMATIACPPDPLIVGERWRAMWQERITALPAFPALWLTHQWRDDYWRHGSVCEDYAAIECAVYAIGGWADGYKNAVPRLLEGLRCPKKGLIGPWAHVYPHDGVPGPAIGFLQEAVRWFDHWLKGVDDGLMAEPAYRVWMQDSVIPASTRDERPGRWVAEAGWPSPRITPQRLFLAPGRLACEAAHPATLSFTSPQTTGLRAGEWCAFGSAGEMPLDQRADDGHALCFDGDPLPARMEILGAPLVELDLEVDRPDALIAVRLNDVAPDGTSLLVTWGVLNLTHKDGHAAPEPLIPGEPFRVRLELDHIAHAFPAGHKIRLALSTSFWPIVWPAPAPVVLAVRTGTAALYIPARPPDDADQRLRAFLPPDTSPGVRAHPLSPLSTRRTVEIDLANNETIYTLESGAFDAALARLEPIDMNLGYAFTKRHWIDDADPLSARSEIVQRITMGRRGWSVRIDLDARFDATPEGFRFSADLRVFDGDDVFASRTFETTIPRALV